jgi:hypothetical protein
MDRLDALPDFKINSVSLLEILVNLQKGKVKVSVVIPGKLTVFNINIVSSFYTYHVKILVQFDVFSLYPHDFVCAWEWACASLLCILVQ